MLKLKQRPEQFELNTASPLAKGLVLAGLGRHTGGVHYHDSSLFRKHGTVTDVSVVTWTFAPCIGRWALQFPGTTGKRVQLGRIEPSNNQFTTSLWVQRNTTGTNVGLIWGLIGNSSGSNNRLHSATNDYVLTQISIDGTVRSGGSFSIDDTAWHHFAITYNGTTLQGYGDGVPLSSPWTGGGTLDVGTTAARIGEAYNNGWAWDGGFSDVMQYHRALSPAEIQQLADPSNALLSGLILPPRRKWWPVVSAAPAFKPAWARKSNNLIGSGVG